jgi:hypothetical protein
MPEPQPPPDPQVEETPRDPELERAIDEALAAQESGYLDGCVDRLDQLEPSSLRVRAQAQEALDLMAACSERPADAEDCDFAMSAEPYCALLLDVELAPRVAYDDAAATPCPFDAPEIAASVPGDPDRCIGVIEGQLPTLEEASREGYVASPEALPRVVLLERRGEEVTEHTLQLDTPSFLGDFAFSCTVSEVRTRRDSAGGLEVVVLSGGPSRECFGGTASTDSFVIYRLEDGPEGQHLRLEEDLSVIYH